ncbi:MAG TPA: ISKra4 family transposase, partial [Flavisolibacter sp.]|nr:ISKra4 family transposase [Flavisolibacter sp.]
MDEIQNKNKKKMLKHLEELTIYIENNRHIIPNYGGRWCYGETIASSFVESAVNEVVTKRTVKK